MKEIQLYRNKGTVLVDDADYEWLSSFRWHIDHGYASRTVQVPIKGVIYMHRMITGVSKELVVDHANGLKLDNRRENLRVCTQSQNNANQVKRRKNVSGYKGVVWHERNGHWQAQIGVNGKCKYLGSFTNKEDAARAYSIAAKQYFGEFANVDI